MDPREVSEERIGLGGAAAILGRSASTVRRYVAEGRLHAERTNRGGYSLLLSEVEELARMLGSSGANDPEATEDEEVFEGEVIGDETFEGNSRLPAVPFQRELQEKTISTLEEEKARLEAERERLVQEKVELVEEKSTIHEERVRLEAELNALKNRGFWSRLFGG